VITYCTNIHPGEGAEETFSNLYSPLLKVKTAVSPDKPFPIGLRLSNRASLETDRKTSEKFSEWCKEHDCYVPTINGFPFGDFHGGTIKEAVYAPDWRCPERVEYTKRLASLLIEWLPEGITGSISTLPVGFRKHISQSDSSLIRKNIIDVLVHIESLCHRHGKEIVLALEPEPGCFLETTEDVLKFFGFMKLPEGLSRFLGICYDCCHQAVEFEDPAVSLSLLAEAGIRIAKVQTSSALCLNSFDRELLRRISEPVYLHQVVVKSPAGRIHRFDDIPEALALYNGDPDAECRIHFHIPVFIRETSFSGTTRSFVESAVRFLDRQILMEVETYTWQQLESELRMQTVEESIISEIKWVESVCEKNSCS
jgi:hypothetical protein